MNDELKMEKALNVVDDVTIVLFIMGAIGWVYGRITQTFFDDGSVGIIGMAGVCVAMFAALGNVVAGVCYDRVVTKNEREKASVQEKQKGVQQL